MPRQNGKNGCIEVVELFGMVALGLKFLHTAHEVKTARKAFRRLLGFFENERQFPELAALATEIRKTNGQEAIVLANGGSVEFVARSSGSGRGFTVDVLVCDEAQDLTDEELAALLPTISSAPSGNALVVLTGTPPDPDKMHLAKGEVFRRVRSDAIKGTDPALCFFDFGVEDGPLPNVDDRALWHRTNPALGTRLNIAELVRERQMMSPETFARERLGWWGDPSAAKEEGAFPAGKWRACEIAEASEVPAAAAVALAVSIDGERATIATAGPWDDGGVHIIDVIPTTVRALADDAKAVLEEAGLTAVAMDVKGPGAHLVDTLESAGLSIKRCQLADMQDACAWLHEAVVGGKVTHTGQPSLSVAVSGAVRRDVGDRWLWGRRKSVGDVSPLEAATLAAWAAHSGLLTDPLANIW